MHTDEYRDDYEAIVIPEEVYLAICKALHSDKIEFMGIA